MQKTFSLVVEMDEDGFYVASVPELPGCHTQAKTLDELVKRAKEAIQAYLEVKKEVESEMKFVGIQMVEVPVR
jgi:predicted RNase H-like HicB family nuclease